MTSGPVTLLGPDIEHRLSLEAMLSPCRAVNWVADSPSFFKQTASSPLARAWRRLDRLWGTRSTCYLSQVQQRLDEQGSQCVLAYWGTEPLPDLIALRRRHPGIHLVLMVLCYPVALTHRGIARQNWLMRRAAKSLDGILFPNEAMRDHFVAKGLCSPDLPSLVLPPCWPAGFQSAGPQPSLSAEPNVIFTGRTDLGSSTIHAADDLRELMAQVMAAGIVLHHVRSPETNDGHPMRRPFAPMSQPELIDAMAHHDASLVAYNTAACECDDRFRLTVPDRLITSVAAGVPVAVPAAGYAGLKQYLAHTPAVLSFDNAAHLQQLLSNRDRLKALHDQAWAARPLYSAEHHAAALNGFLSSLPQRAIQA